MPTSPDKTPPPPSLAPIETLHDIQAGLEALKRIDRRLAAVADAAGEIPLRRRNADFEGLAHIIVGQQVSVASASAIFARLSALITPLDAPTLARFTDEDLAGTGLSRPKIRTLRAVGLACADGLDLANLASRPADEAHATLCAIKGIGPWTADIFLLFCAGHPDVFPCGDLALQAAVQDAFGLTSRPAARALADIASDWAPHRAVAARLFWAFYRARKQSGEAFPL